MSRSTLRYEVTGRIARITLDRPDRGNGITFEMPDELAACVEEANLNRAVHVIARAGAGKGLWPAAPTWRSARICS
jgi:enoyl-CoA hydratase